MEMFGSQEKWAIRKFDEIIRLSRDIAPAGLALYEYGYVPQGAMTGWYVIVGTHELHVRFFWDDRDSVMLVYEAPAPFGNEDWRHPEVGKLPVGVDAEKEPYRFIKEVLKRYFGDKVQV